MTSLVLLLLMTERQGAEIVTVIAANLAKMEWILVLAMNMGTFVRCLSRRNGLNALKSLGDLSVLGVLIGFMSSSEGGLDGLG
jgi:hypothetical protein